jgi:hypothetical protein
LRSGGNIFPGENLSNKSHFIIEMGLLKKLKSINHKDHKESTQRTQRAELYWFGFVHFELS